MSLTGREDSEVVYSDRDGAFESEMFQRTEDLIKKKQKNNLHSMKYFTIKKCFDLYLIYYYP